MVLLHTYYAMCDLFTSRIYWVAMVWQALSWSIQVVIVVKNLSASAGDVRDMSLIPGLGRSSGEGHGNPLQYSCLENPVDRGAWQATVHRVEKSRAQLKQLSMHAHTHAGMWTRVTYQILYSFPWFKSPLINDSRMNQSF